MSISKSVKSDGAGWGLSTEYTMDDLAKLINALHQAMEDLSNMLCLQRKTLNVLRVQVLENDVLHLINEHYSADKNRLEHESSLDILKQSGAVTLIKKILWSDDLTDWCLSVALEKMIPGLEVLVEKYPDIVMDDAYLTTMKIFGRARQAFVVQDAR